VSGGRSAAIDEDLPEAEFQAEKYIHADVHAKNLRQSKAVRSIIEIQRNLGGMRWRAMLGGTWLPKPGRLLALDVGIVSASAVSAGPDCPSLLKGEFSYRVGLTEEFAPHALNGMLEKVGQLSLGPGVILIDRAGFDDESSSIIFRLAGRMLVTVLAALAHGEDPTAEALAELTS